MNTFLGGWFQSLSFSTCISLPLWGYAVDGKGLVWNGYCSSPVLLTNNLSQSKIRSQWFSFSTLVYILFNVYAAFVLMVLHLVYLSRHRLHLHWTFETSVILTSENKHRRANEKLPPEAPIKPRELYSQLWTLCKETYWRVREADAIFYLWMLCRNWGTPAYPVPWACLDLALLLQTPQCFCISPSMTVPCRSCYPLLCFSTFFIAALEWLVLWFCTLPSQPGQPTR